MTFVLLGPMKKKNHKSNKKNMSVLRSRTLTG